MSAIRGAKIRPSAKQAVEEAEQEMHEEHLDNLDMFADLAHDDEDFDWSHTPVDPSFFRTIAEQEAVHKKYSNHGSLGEEPLRFERKLRRLRRQLTHTCRSSLPAVDTQFDDTPIFIQLFKESDLQIKLHLLTLRRDHVGQVLFEDEEFQDFHSGVGVDGLDREIVKETFDWLFNPANYLD